MTERKLKPREQWLVVALAAAALVMWYLVFPLRAHRAAADKATWRADRAAAEIEGFAAAVRQGRRAPSQRTIDRLAAELATLRDERTAVEARLAELGAPRSTTSVGAGDRGAPETLEEINLDLSALARRCGANIVDNVPLQEGKVRELLAARRRATDRSSGSGDTDRISPPRASGRGTIQTQSPAATPTGTDNLLPADPSRCTFRRLTMETSFQGMCAFAEGLIAFSPRLVLLGFTVNTADPSVPRNASISPAPLEVELIWVLL